MNPKSLHASLYYADDQDIYDVLTSARQKLSAQKLLDLAASRHMILSPNEGRDGLVDILSMQPFSWTQLNELLGLLERAERREKLTSIIVDIQCTSEDLTAAAETVEKRRAIARGEVYSKQSSGGKGITLKVEYAEFDQSRTRLRQRVDRELEIDMRIESGQLRIRYNATNKAKYIVQELIQEIAKDVLPKEVTLYGIKNPGIRNQFFLDLFRLPGHRVVDVKSVRVSSKHDREEEDSAQDAGDAVLLEEDKLTEEDVEVAGIVKRIALEGSQVLASQEYQSLTRRENFIHRAVWVVEPEKDPNVQVELEAGFSSPVRGEGFEYSVRGVTRRHDKTKEFKKTPERPDTAEMLVYTSLIEKSADDALEAATKTAVGDGDAKASLVSA